MPKVRVYVPTYQRHIMLARALKSLVAQTYNDWVCEVHNDDPADKFPEKLVKEIADPRIIIINHEKKQGGAKTINNCYAPTSENFISILEDDNWWEPDFLEEMVKAVNKNKHATVFWSNMKIWIEKPDGSFEDTKEFTNKNKANNEFIEYWWPCRQQILGAVHSNGACLVRSGPLVDFRIPDVPLATIESFRERMFPQPLIFVNKPLANFSVTLKTAREGGNPKWVEALTALAATFFKYSKWSQKEKEDEFSIGKTKYPPNTDIFLNAALVEKKCRFFFRLASPIDLLKWSIRHLMRPQTFFKILLSRKTNKKMWAFLETNMQKK